MNMIINLFLLTSTMFFRFFVLIFYCQALLFRSTHSTKRKEIPDLNFPPPKEKEVDVLSHKERIKTSSVPTSIETFKNKNHDDKEVSVIVKTTPTHLIETGLFRKSILINGKRYYSDTMRKEWQARKRKQRSMQSDEIKREIYRKEYYQKKQKLEKLDPIIQSEKKEQQRVKDRIKHRKARAAAKASAEG